MTNSLVSQVLEELANYTELEDEQPYRARAYRKAAQTIESLPDDIKEYWKKGTLQELPGVGENIENKIDEILRTGKLQTLEKVKERNPVDVSSLTRVEGVGPKTVKLLYRDLKIRNLDDFETAVKEGRLRSFKGLGVKSDRLLLERIEAARQGSNRILLAKAKFLADRISEQLKNSPTVKRFAIAGSYRRKKETIGDFDVLIETDDPKKSIDYFTKIDEIKEVTISGETKTSVKIESNFQVDVRVITAKSWGAALLYFTGSKSHNIELRTRAIGMGLRLNEYGLFRSEEEMVAGATEEAVYRALDLDYVEPEMRENKGEIRRAEMHDLPALVTRSDIRGDLQMHTNWSDGTEDLVLMAEKAKMLGYEYIAITDHVGSLKIANALDADRINTQRKEIEKMNKDYERAGNAFHILHGAEVNIRADGSMDLSDSELKNFEIVLGSIHSGFNDDEEKITRRITTAMENEYVDIIAHPTGRLLLERSGYRFDLPKVIKKAIDTETLLEIDGHTNRLDLNDEKAMDAIKSGCRLSVDTDSHSSQELEYMEFGVATARRAWAEKKDILNTLGYKELVKFLGK